MEDNFDQDDNNKVPCYIQRIIIKKFTMLHITRLHQEGCHQVSLIFIHFSCSQLCIKNSAEYFVEGQIYILPIKILFIIYYDFT